MKKLVYLSICFISLLQIYNLFNKIELKEKCLENEKKQGIEIKFLKSDPYTSHCIDLYKKLRYPNQNLIIRPPPEKPPADMMDDFTMNGKMPITKYWYFNEAYNDSNSNNKSVINEIVSTELNDYLNKVRKNEKLNYGDKVLNKMMHLYWYFIKDKIVAVIGTQLPWIEAIAYDIGASFITTLDYTRKQYNFPNLNWVHINDYLEEQIENKRLEYFDVIVSFSSIEHSGLGRYGDPLSPYGDVDAVKQVHCMLKPGGLFFLGLPTTTDGSSKIEFNAHRIYGKERLNLLFKGWNLLEQNRDTTEIHTIFVLQKKDGTIFQ